MSQSVEIHELDEEPEGQLDFYLSNGLEVQARGPRAKCYVHAFSEFLSGRSSDHDYKTLLRGKNTVRGPMDYYSPAVDYAENCEEYLRCNAYPSDGFTYRYNEKGFTLPPQRRAGDWFDNCRKFFDATLLGLIYHVLRLPTIPGDEEAKQETISDGRWKEGSEQRPWWAHDRNVYVYFRDHWDPDFQQVGERMQEIYTARNESEHIVGIYQDGKRQMPKYTSDYLKYATKLFRHAEKVMIGIENIIHKKLQNDALHGEE